jgi:hypothetical protein
MYYDRCGASLASNAQFCSSCGKQVVQAPIASSSPAASPFTEGRVRRHIHRLATLWLVSGILRLLLVGSFMSFGRMFFPFLRGWGGPVTWPFGLFWPFGSLFPLGIFLGFFGILHLVLAWGLFERQPWARALGLILGILAVVRFPLGTALGIYTLWVLAPEQSSREYDRLSQSGAQMHSAPFSS